MTIRIIVMIEVVHGQLGHVLDAFRGMVPETCREDGCITFDVFLSEDEEDSIVLIEEWVDQSAIDSHMKMAYTEQFLGKVETSFCNPPNARHIRLVEDLTEFSGEPGKRSVMANSFQGESLAPPCVDLSLEGREHDK